MTRHALVPVLALALGACQLAPQAPVPLARQAPPEVSVVASSAPGNSSAPNPDSRSTIVDEGINAVGGGIDYSEFSPSTYAARLGSAPMVLFFHATWCPNCRALDATITTGLRELQGDVPLYRVDYDTQAALKRTYGIRMQHTLVAIDADGKVRATQVGVTTLAEVQRLLDAAKS